MRCRPLYMLPLFIFFAILLHLPCLAAPSQNTSIEAQVNVPYVIQFGFGSYNMGGISTDTFRIPLSKTFAFGKDKNDWSLKLTSYLGYSHATFETDMIGPKLTATQDYLFLLPQAELLIPVQEGLTIKPYVAAGFGWAFNGSVELVGYQQADLNDSYDFLLASGLGALFETSVEQYKLGFGSKLGWAQVTPLSGGGEQGFATFQTGIEARHPIGISIKEKMLDLAGSFIYYYFFPPAKFTIPGDRPLEVFNQYEFGASIGFEKPSRLWIFDNPRIGASYRFGDGMTGIRVNFGFPF